MYKLGLAIFGAVAGYFVGLAGASAIGALAAEDGWGRIGLGLAGVLFIGPIVGLVGIGAGLKVGQHLDTKRVLKSDGGGEQSSPQHPDEPSPSEI
ncbi:MAG: hypothetical protein KC561_12910 [Myxococcales bacterium]|nr:hypothetical protein [Myxococcales bacterium]